MRSSFDHFNGLSEIAQFVSEAKIAEQVMSTSSNLAVFQCRSSLEHAINWMYSIDKDLSSLSRTWGISCTVACQEILYHL